MSKKKQPQKRMNQLSCQPRMLNNLEKEMKQQLYKSILMKDDNVFKEVRKIAGDNYSILQSKFYMVLKNKHHTIAPLICCHIDTVGDDIFWLVEENGVIRNKYGILGGDDRCGITIALDLIAQNADCHFAFFDLEEVGAIGSEKFLKNINAVRFLVSNCSCLIGLDRRGNSDAAIYHHICPELMRVCENHGYREAFGSFTDVAMLSENLQIPTVNLSVGFYNEHSPFESVRISDVINTKNKLLLIIDELKQTMLGDVEDLYGDWDYYDQDKSYFGQQQSEYKELMINGKEIEYSGDNYEPREEYLDETEDEYLASLDDYEYLDYLEGYYDEHNINEGEKDGEY